MALVLLLIFVAVPRVEEPARCDVVELNHVYDGEGKKALSQWIFWKWSDRDCRYHVLAWRRAKACRRPAVVGQGRGERYRVTIVAAGVVRRVDALVFRETWTQYDREVFDRQFVPEDEREGLR